MLSGLLRTSTIIISWALCVSASAEIIKFQVPACQTDDLLSEFNRYIITNDPQGANQLFQYGQCILLEQGDEVSLAKWGFSTSIIRVAGIKYYLASEALEKGSNRPTKPLQKQEKSTVTQKPNTGRQKQIKELKPNPNAGQFVLQVISTDSQTDAQKMESQIQELGYEATLRVIQLKEKTTYRVITQAFEKKENALDAKKRIDSSLQINSLVLPIK